MRDLGGRRPDDRGAGTDKAGTASEHEPVTHSTLTDWLWDLESAATRHINDNIRVYRLGLLASVGVVAVVGLRAIAKSPVFRRLRRVSDVTAADLNHRLTVHCLVASAEAGNGWLKIVHVPWYAAVLNPCPSSPNPPPLILTPWMQSCQVPATVPLGGAC